ncbi:alpha/beta fold hydrolase [uncultured Jannaschia sp.]|uniref:alpha/beta fold hydrolase n=1 Tax=uncultured Jannaschia sp. TaxID=293347 RepID=UPI00262DF059|nr:alpha/beta fold hydrolase [uncultured Jannaschia sp.]
MRTILALHCMLASGAAWRGVQGAMPETRLVCPDLPGHGHAAPWDAARPFMDQAVEIAWAAVPPGAFDLIGHSYGGCVALRLLAEAPDRIRSLTLVEPVMFAAAEPALQAANRTEMAPVDAAMEAGDRDAAARAFTGRWGDGSAWDALPDRRRAYIRNRIHLIAASAPGIVADVHTILSRLPADPPPVTIVTRRDPPAVVAGVAAGLRARLPGARIVEAGAGHMIPVEAPEALAEQLRAAIAGT